MAEFGDHFSIKCHPMIMNGQPLVVLRLVRINAEESEGGHNFLLTLDQVDILQSDLELARARAISEYVRERAMLNELHDDLDEWGDPSDEPPEEGTPE